MIHPEQYIRPLLRKRTVGNTTNEWENLNIESNKIEGKVSRWKDNKDDSQFNISKLINKHTTPNLENVSPNKNDQLSKSLYGIDEPEREEFKFEMKIVRKGKKRNQVFSQSMTRKHNSTKAKR